MSEKEMDLTSEAMPEENIENMFLTFKVANEDYAVGIKYVTEIVGIQDFKKVPDVPEFIKGVINLRGKVIPIMDVRTRFGLKPQEYTDRTCIIVLEVEGVPTGVVVDEVSDVREMVPEDISPPPSWKKDEGKSVISGLGKLGDMVCTILDVEKFLFSKDVDLTEGDKSQPESADLEKAA